MIPPIIESTKALDFEVNIRHDNNYFKINSSEEFKDILDRILAEFTFDGLIVLKIPVGRVNLSKEDLIFSSSNIYYSVPTLADFATWSTLAPLRTSYMPYRFQVASDVKTERSAAARDALSGEKMDPVERIFLAQARAHSGCCVPFLTGNGTKALALFISDKSDSDSVDLGRLYLNVLRLAEFLDRSQTSTQSLKRNILNSREKECLRWVAAGKTSSEIAKITSLSEHTVNHYLQVCCKKLDTVNRAQAAVSAIKLELL